VKAAGRHRFFPELPVTRTFNLAVLIFADETAIQLH